MWTALSPGPYGTANTHLPKQGRLWQSSSLSGSEFMLIAVAIVIVLGLSGLRVAQEYQRGVVFDWAAMSVCADRDCIGSFRSISSAQLPSTFVRAPSRLS